jgi:hypothetical protein
MAKTQTDSANILTNPDELKKFKQMIVTVTHYLQQMDDNREAISETITEAAATFSVDKKIIRKLANAMFKGNYADLQEEQERFELMYESMTGSRLTVRDPLEENEED